MTVTRCTAKGSPVYGCPCSFCRQRWDLIVCPRCEGQQFYKDDCGLCANRGVLDENGERLKDAAA